MHAAGPDLTGAVLDGRYRVIEAIAEGAMGVVYRAERIKLGRIVAIKVMHESLPAELASRQRFEIEAMAMAKLEHPHCAAVLDVGVHEDRPYVVMDFVSGDNLKDTIERRRLPIVRVVEIMRQVLSGLAHAHELGIIHRDIKPANVVLSQKAGLGDHVKILDFGLARLGGDRLSQPALTVGLVVGTPSYMAPEQCTGGVVDGRTDLYACGVMLFELLTGQKPFVSEHDDPVDVVRMHMQTPPPTLADATGQEFGPELEAIVARALAKRPDDRYATATEFAAELDVIRARLMSAPVALPGPITPTPLPFRSAPDLPAPPAPAIAPQHPIHWIPLDRRQLRIAGSVLGALVVLVIVAVAVSGNPKPAVPRDAGVVAVTPPEPIEMPAVGPDPQAELVERAQQLIDAGKRDAALELIDKGRGVFPANARLAFMAGKLYFGKLYWNAGLKAFHEAIANDPSYRTNAEVIKAVLRGFITTPSYNADLATFLRVEIGPEARPFLEEAATSHPNAAIRARAAAELKRYR